jgi:hypothetical protein
MTTLRIDDVFEKIEHAAVKNALLPRDANILRLLGEEMFSMTMNLADSTDCVFNVWNSEKQFELCLCAKAEISPESKRNFVSASSRRENALAKGLTGKIRSAIEDYLYYGGSGGYLAFCYDTMGEYSQVWSLNMYMINTPPEKLKEDWDGLERSILINMADDIIIGVGKGLVEMKVKKSFEV